MELQTHDKQIISDFVLCSSRELTKTLFDYLINLKNNLKLVNLKKYNK